MVGFDGGTEEEKLLNETTSGCKIIGITCETRPDCVTPDSLRFLRRVGCTRVQLGLQHEVVLATARCHQRRVPFAVFARDRRAR